MKIGLAQMSMESDMEANFLKSLGICEVQQNRMWI